MKELFANLDVALFDLDGTLVETNIDFALMRSEMLRIAGNNGIGQEMLETLDILGIVDRVEDELRLDGRNDRASAFRVEAFRILEEIELRHSAETKEIESARELLDELRGRNIKVGIVTRNCRTASEMSLEIVGIQPDILLCREDVKLTKPHPEQLLKALEVLRGTPKRSMMVGDHLMDIRAGKAAGTRTVGVLMPERPRDFFDELSPDAVVESLKELVDAIIDCHS